jgi:hypothetical protein
MYKFKKLNPTDGFDFNNLDNARQNNYAWSIAELGDYIYVGTGRNIPLMIIQAISPGINVPAIFKPINQDNLAEIWRYKKNGQLPWERVYKAEPGSGITGFRFMLNVKPVGSAHCLYASTYGSQVKILKSYNGVDWFVMPYDSLVGSSSRYMVTIKGKLYLAAVDEINASETPFLYRNKDPEFYPWENVTDTTNPNFDPDKNPQGSISNMAVFNNKLYVSTSLSSGVQVWRSNKEVPEMNDWTLIVDKGFGDEANQYSLSIGVFNDYVYVSGTKPLPLSYALPLGVDIIRIDKYDNWQLVVGGQPLMPSTPSKGVRSSSLSGYNSGFSNPFNVYAWQIQEYNNSLLISTFDDSSNMEVILDTLLANKEYLINEIGNTETEELISIYKKIVRLLAKLKYPIGFDLYSSFDGVHFKPVFKDGMNNMNNYGGRILYVGNDNKLIIGTANPFDGCQVWKCIKEDFSCNADCNGYHNSIGNSLIQYKIERIIFKNFDLLRSKLPIIMSLLQK